MLPGLLALLCVFALLSAIAGLKWSQFYAAAMILIVVVVLATLYPR